MSPPAADFESASARAPTSRAVDPGSSTWMLAVCGGSLVLAIALFATTSTAIHLLGWALGSIIPLLLIALFRRRGQARLLEVGIAPTPFIERLATAMVLMGIAVAGLHAWFVAIGVA